jgi:hypothetical protein
MPPSSAYTAATNHAVLHKTQFVFNNPALLAETSFNGDEKL